MQEKNLNSRNSKSVLSIYAFWKYIKLFFSKWLLFSIIAAFIIVSCFTIIDFTQRTVSVTVNFSFDGVESGHDPLGNKFNVNEIKSDEAIEKAVNDVGIGNYNIENISDSIYISGNIPANAINRITDYVSIYESDVLNSNKDIQDKTYYPTQYTITLNCNEVDLSVKECTDFLNTLTENYKHSFIEKYGYKESLANAVTAFDYNDYDYSEAIFVFDSSLESLQSYINYLASKDNVRFRSKQTGYTFSDLTQSIETLRNENLDIISSYISLNNMTKNKENLLVNYEYKVDDYKRQKKIYEDKYETITKTLEMYEKNSILIFAQATTGTDASLNQSSDTYDNLIQLEIDTEKNISFYEQQIEKFNKRIKSLKDGIKKGSVDKLEEDFAKLNDKINTLLEAINVSVSEYYTDVIFTNSYDIISPASSSNFAIFTKSIRNSFLTCVSVELLIFSVYLLICTVASLPVLNDFFSAAAKKIFKQKNTKTKTNKKNKNKGGRK